MTKSKTAPAPQPAVAAGPEIREPTQTQQLMLDAPFADDLCVFSARGTGKSWGIVLVVARDAAHFKEKYSCLITRTTFQGLTELQGLLWRYLSVLFPGTSYSGSDMTFRLGGKDMPFGKVELAYTGAGPGDQVKALARLQGRSFICAIHVEVGNHFDSAFIDSAAATLRGPEWWSRYSDAELDQMQSRGQRLVADGFGSADPQYAAWLVDLWKQK